MRLAHALLSSLAVLLAQASGVSAQDDPNKPKEVAVAKNGFADLSVKIEGGAACIWFVSPTPVQTATGIGDGRTIFGGVPGKVYDAQAAVLTLDGMAIKTRMQYYRVTFPGVPDPGTNPGNPPPTDPPVMPPAGPYYVMVVRPDGPADPYFTKLMANAAWDAIRAAGHSVKDFTVTEARKLGATIPAAGTFPMAIVLKTVTDATGQKKSVEVRGAFILTPAGIPNILAGLP